VVAGTKVDGHHFLKFTLLNAETTLGDMVQIIELLRSTGETLRNSAVLTGGAA
jgi:L-2,4-diaminobutyrate decarboxylase